MHEPDVEPPGSIAGIDDLLAVGRPGGAGETHGAKQILDVNRADARLLRGADAGGIGGCASLRTRICATRHQTRSQDPKPRLEAALGGESQSLAQRAELLRQDAYGSLDRSSPAGSHNFADECT